MNVGGDMRTIRQAIDAMARMRPEAAFLIGAETGSIVSSEMLQRDAVLLANMLGQAGLERGDKVAFLMDNGLLTAQLFLGTMYGGFVAVPLNVRAGVMQMSYMLDHCDAKIVFVDDQYSELLREAMESVRREIRVVKAHGDGPMPAFETPGKGMTPPPVDADDVAMLMYSSGSTGKPKAAIHTHSTVLAHGHNSIEAHQLTATDRSLLVLPIYHINAECVTLIPTLLSGGSVVVARRFVVSRFWDWIDDYQVTWSALVPTILSELVNWDDPGKDKREAAFARIRFFRSSSAPLSPTLHRQFLDKFHLPLLQAMGSTEGGNIFSNPVPPGENKIGSPGLAWGFEVRVADRQGADVAAGESGEMLLRGPALMKGYYKDSDGTAAVLDSDGWFHTGDLARRDEDGYFFVVGRSKELIIKGGVNIAPRQIDEVLEAHPAVLEAAAVGIPDRYFGEDAVAFVVLRSTAAADEKELLAFCETRLGHFKTPSRVHFLSELPKGPSGKVQRLRLLDPEVLAAVALKSEPGSDAPNSTDSGHGGAGEPAPSLSSIQGIITTAWAEVLGRPHVDPDANFFALGGHSLLAIQCLSKLREKLPIVLTIADFFEHLTIAEQAELVRERLRPVGGAQNGASSEDSSADWEHSLLQQFVPPPTSGIPRRPPSPLSPLSPAQEGLWFLEQFNQDAPVYNEAEAVRLTGDLNVAALESALNGVIARHEVLRSTVKVIDGMPYMEAHATWPVSLERIDLSELSAVDRRSEVDRLLIDKPRVPYSLETAPGIRVSLLQLGPREHVLILMMHHIVCDWSSEGVIWRELSALYRSSITGEQVELDALPVTSGDYAEWQRQRLSDGSFTEDIAFWEDNLQGAPALLELPTDRVRPAVMSHRGDRLRWNLSRKLTEKLRETSRVEKVSLFTVFATALNVLFHRYTGSDDILLGVPLADRDQPELRSVIGFLLLTHVLRTRLSGEVSFRDLLGRVQKEVLELYTHRSAPFDQIVRQIQPQRNQSYTPLFQVLLNWRDRDQALPFIGMEGLAIESLMAHSKVSKFDLTFVATDWGDEIELELEYSTDLFDEATIRRMLGHYEALLEAVAADPAVSIARMPLLTSGERGQILGEWNETQREFPTHKCIHELFEEQVTRTPEATAVVFEKNSLSYAELNRRANRLAHHLRSLGVTPDARVAVCAERSLEMVVALLGILKSGAAYVPLEPSYPVDRLHFMLKDAAPVALLIQRPWKELFRDFDGAFPVVELESDQFSKASEPANDENPRLIGGSKNLAYVIYTSGSTGIPKGVGVEHISVVNGLAWLQDAYPLRAREAILQKTPFGFDVSVWEFFWPLMCGARLVMARPEGHKDAGYLLGVIRENKITVMFLVPSLLQALLEHPDVEGMSRMALVVTGGEALPAAMARRFQQRLPNPLLLNVYGPTETTVWVTAWPCPEPIKDDRISIGRPIANTRAYILNENLELLPPGVAGELYIAGVQVAREYLNRPELTAERFLRDPFSNDPDARMYRTGDLARWFADGNLEFLGRNDFQVKIRGFRVELGEIEARLAEHPDVQDAVVIAREDTPGNKRLVAYYTIKNAGVAAEQLRSLLASSLPEYMVPTAYIVLANLPLTPNGKLDRKELPAPDGGSIAGPEFVAPRDAVEVRLVEIWKQILNIPQLGVRDNFFELGGHSLLAMRLSFEIKKAFNLTLALRELFVAPTIEGQAKLVSESQAHSARDLIVPLQKGDASKPPFFMIHSYHLYPLLPQRLGSQQPFYGIQEYSPRDKVGDWSLESMMSMYVKAIRSVAPHGPYFIGGFCSAAVPAFEVVRQLQEAGESVPLLVLIDAPGKYAQGGPPQTSVQRLNAMVKNNRADWKFHSRRLKQLSAGDTMGEARRLAASKLQNIAMKINIWCWTRMCRFYMGRGGTIPSFLRHKLIAGLRVVTLEAIRHYTLKPIAADISVFLASDSAVGRGAQEVSPWAGNTSGKVDVVRLPGNHTSAFLPPNIDVFARELRAYLDAALESPAKVQADCEETSQPMQVAISR